MAGTMLSGPIADRLVRGRASVSAMLRLPLFALPLSAPFVAGFVFAPSLTLAMLCAAVMNVLISVAFVPCVNYAITLAHPGDRGLTSTVMLVSYGLIGGALGPFIVGGLSDIMTPRLGAEGLRFAISAMIVTPLVAAAFLLAAIRCERF